MSQEPIILKDVNNNKDNEFSFDNVDNAKSDDKNNNQTDQNTTSENEELNENLLKYDEIKYTTTDRINLIKKIEMYINDPDLKKIAMRKIHIKEYLVKSKLVKLDAKTLNWVYDELRNYDITSGLADTAFNGYITVNNIIEASLCKFKIDVSGYTETLDNYTNRLLLKQITIDNFNYMSGMLTPEYALGLNTIMSISGAYKTNILKKKEIKIENEENIQNEQNKQNEQNEQNTEAELQDKKNNIILTDNDEQMEKIKKFINPPT
jgi:hypothetical protein